MSFNDDGGNWYGSSPSYQHSSEEFSEYLNQATKNIKDLIEGSYIVRQLTLNIGKPKDSKKNREQLEDKMSAATKLLRDTHAIIKKLEVISSTISARDKKQMVDKLSHDFEFKVNKPYQELLREAKQVLDETPMPTSPTYSGYGGMYGQSPTEEESFLQKRQHEEQQFLAVQDDADFQESLIHERDREIKTIQGQVIQVNEIFREVARLVEDQGEMVENIQTNISHVTMNVKSANEDLGEANKSQQSSRKKICLIALIITLLVAVVVIVVVVVLKTKN